MFVARMVAWKIAQESYILTATALLHGAAWLDRRAGIRAPRPRAVCAGVHTPLRLVVARWSGRGGA